MDASPTSRLLQLINQSRQLMSTLDELISTIRGNVMISVGWTGALVFLGIATTCLFYSMERFDRMTDLLKVGPTLLGSSVSAFQIKTIMVARERLFSYRSLRARLEHSQVLQETQIEALIAESIKALEDLRKRE